MESEHQIPNTVSTPISPALAGLFELAYLEAQKELGGNIFMLVSHFDKTVFAANKSETRYEVKKEVGNTQRNLRI